MGWMLTGILSGYFWRMRSASALRFSVGGRGTSATRISSGMKVCVRMVWCPSVVSLERQIAVLTSGGGMYPAGRWMPVGKVTLWARQEGCYLTEGMLILELGAHVGVGGLCGDGAGVGVGVGVGGW